MDGTVWWKRAGGVGVALALLAGLCVGALAPAAAQNGDEGAAATMRFVHASPGAPAVDVVVDGERVVEGLSFGAASDYVTVPAGDRQVQITPAGESSDAALIDEEIDVDDGEAYIVAAVGNLNEIEAQSYEVDLDATEGGQARVRVIHAAPDADDIDVAVAGGDTLFEGVGFKDSSDYEDLDAGTYDLEVRQDDEVILSAPGIQLDAGTAYDLVAIGQVSDDSLRLLPLATAVSPPCSALLGVGTPEDACLRFVHASPDAPELDFYVSETAAAETIAFGDATGFAALPAEDDQEIAVTTAGAAMDEAVADEETDFEAGQAYQAVVVGMQGEDDGLDLLISEVDLSPLPAEQSRLRVIHAAPDVGGIDVGVVDGPTVFEGVDFQDSADYTTLDAGMYDLAVMADDEVVVRAHGVTIGAGFAYDAIVIGRAEDNSLTILLLEANATLREGGVASPVAATPAPAASPVSPEVVGTPAP